MDQIKYQGYARDRGFNPVQLSTASVDAIGQQGGAMLRQMRDNQDAERRTRDAFLSGMQNAQQLEQQNRAANFEFSQRNRERYQEAVSQNLKQSVLDARMAQQNIDQQVTVLGALAPLSETVGKMLVKWKEQKDENEKMDEYVNTYINGPDPKEEVRVEAGLTTLREADQRIQTTANNLRDAEAAPEQVRAVRKLSKMQKVGRAMALAEMAVPQYGGFLEDSYRNDAQSQPESHSTQANQDSAYRLQILPTGPALH